MPFLYLENGEVFPTEEGMEIPAVKSVYNADKTDGKVFFRDVLKYLYYVYRKDGVYSDMFEQMRKTTVIERHLPKRDYKVLESNKRVQELIKEYLERQMTKNERLLYLLEKDIEKLLERISSIPYTKTCVVKVPHTNDDGETTMLPTKIEFDNIEEKSKAIKEASSLVDYSDKLRSKILKEKIEDKKKGTSTRLFDKAVKK